MNEKELETLVQTKERVKSNTHRIEKLEENTRLLMEMNTNIQLIAQQNVATKEDVEDMKKDMSQLCSELSEVKSATMVRDSKMLGNIKWLILSGVIGYLLNYLMQTIVK